MPVNKKKIAKAMQHPDKLGAGAAKRRSSGLNKQEKFATVMKEFGRGTLHSGSGPIVTNRKQAQAIAASESGMQKKRRK